MITKQIKIDEIRPDPDQCTDRIIKITQNLKVWIRNNPMEKVGLIHAPRIVMNINLMKILIEKWFNQEDENSDE